MFIHSTRCTAPALLVTAILLAGCRPSGSPTPDAEGSQSEATPAAGSSSLNTDSTASAAPRTFSMADAWTEVPPNMLYGFVLQRPLAAPRDGQVTSHQLLARLLQSVFGYAGASGAIPRELDALGIANDGLIVAAWDADTHRFMSLPLRAGADPATSISQFAQFMGDAPGTGPRPATLPGYWQGDRYVYTVHRQRLYLGRLPIPLRDFLQGGSPEHAPRDPGVSLPPDANPALAVFFQPDAASHQSEWRGLQSAWLWVPLTDGATGLATGDLRWNADAPLPAGLADGSGFAPIPEDELWLASTLTPSGAQFLAQLTASNGNSPVSGRNLLASLLGRIQPAVPAEAAAWLDGRVLFATQAAGLRVQLGTRVPVPAAALQQVRQSVCTAMDGTLDEAGHACCRQNEWCATAVANDDTISVYVALSGGQVPDPTIATNAVPASEVTGHLRAGLAFRALEWLVQMPVRDVAGLRDGCGEDLSLLASNSTADHTTVSIQLGDPTRLASCIVAMRDTVVRQDGRLLFAEAESNVHRISANAARVVRRWVREQGSIEGATLPADTGITPPLDTIATACEQNFGVLNTQPILWDTAEWRTLDFILYDAHRFVYRFESQGEGDTLRATTTAYGDLDCDGVYSTWYRDSSIVDGELVAQELTWVETGDD